MCFITMWNVIFTNPCVMYNKQAVLNKKDKAAQGVHKLIT
jgi:hypothetical protein